ncbi:prepilin-type N-terminal cleavage/methylation domain-containing protein [Sulfurimonas sp. SWIR-19]|uniref:type II secretion system protein n=1 Tax=Sulfurimonas sp. SWIR-19 TaxID=2878390 RepID=UPI001CF15803|nr:type II secretion system protein [Sulfurimonas sp. SWIR-19]UCN00792.1 prepilin-type N-terminal cleavage/methylation domain-containing protein [Sulfurimonas sp. SWIR-19]
MKKAFTLIELIFSMVIIAIAFSVLPKILQLSIKSSTTSLKEEAMYNAVAYVGLIKSTAWDEENTKIDDILLVTAGNSVYDCNQTTGYRTGGMKGSRNCFHKKYASALGSDSNDLDDMDDFITLNAKNSSSSRDYNLSVTENYIDDITLSATQYTITYPPNATDTTNTKLITVTVQANKKGNVLGNSFVKIPFIAQNIGQIKVNRRVWQ